MTHKVEYITYNNQAFKHTTFCKSDTEARALMTKLGQLPHVSDVRIRSEAGQRITDGSCLLRGHCTHRLGVWQG